MVAGERFFWRPGIHGCGSPFTVIDYEIPYTQPFAIRSASRGSSKACRIKKVSIPSGSTMTRRIFSIRRKGLAGRLGLRWQPRLSDSRHFSDQWPHLLQVDGEGCLIAHQLDVAGKRSQGCARYLQHQPMDGEFKRSVGTGKAWFLPFLPTRWNE